MLEKEMLTMPKIDLHCHLDGSMTLQSIREILGREVQLSELQVSEDCKSLAEYLRKFDLPLECIQTPEGLKESAKEFLLNLQEDHVKYVEVRFAPQLSISQGMNCGRVMEAVLEGLKEGEVQCGIHSEVIACMMRYHNEETNLQMLKDCREFLGEGLCAVDPAGDEAGFPTKNFCNLFETAKKLDYPIREFAKAGVLVTINTDNRTVSNTSIGKEMRFLQEGFEITSEELRQYQRNAVEAAFCDDSIKHELWKCFG